jgi:hypothetical protein
VNKRQKYTTRCSCIRIEYFRPGTRPRRWPQQAKDHLSRQIYRLTVGQHPTKVPGRGTVPQLHRITIKSARLRGRCKPLIGRHPRRKALLCPARCAYGGSHSSTGQFTTRTKLAGPRGGLFCTGSPEQSASSRAHHCGRNTRCMEGARPWPACQTRLDLPTRSVFDRVVSCDKADGAA